MTVEPYITELVFERFRVDLAECGGITPGAIERGSKLTDLVPLSCRREVWRGLAERGYRLPALQLALPVQLTSVLSVLVRSAALAWLLQHPAFLAAILPFGWLTWRSTHHLAVHPPIECNTVYEAAVHATPFRRQDYEAGLWSLADLSVKIRATIALSSGRSLESVQPESKLVDLCR